MVRTYEGVQEEAVVERVACVSEEEGLVWTFCGVEDELGDGLAFVFGICACGAGREWVSEGVRGGTPHRGDRR